jgi:hypothetical protein
MNEQYSTMEMAMSYALSRDFFHSPRGKSETGSNARGRKPGLLRRIVQATFESRQAEADREITAFIARSGGRFTDDVERRITQHLLSRGNWSGREKW